MRDLVFIHGRAQEHKDSKALKDEWIAAWAEGLKKTDCSCRCLTIRFIFRTMATPLTS